MALRRIFITTVAVMLTSAVFADSASVTSKKYVDDLMTGYQNKIPGAGTNKLMIYDSTQDDGINQKAIVSSLGENTSATDVPNVGAVLDGLDGKQDTFNGTQGYVMTGTGTPGEVGERAIYSANTNYSNALVTAETVNTGVINAVNSSLRRVNENGDLDSNGTLWEINTSLLALDVLGYLPDGYTKLQYVDMNSGSYLLTDIVPTYDSKVEMDFQTTSIQSGAASYLGGRSASYPAGLRLGTSSGNSRLIVTAFSDSAYTATTVVENNTRYKFTFNNKVATLESGGSTLFTNTFTGENANGAALVINGLNSAGTITANSEGIYLYSFKVWNPTGQLVANYVPATYNNTVGFYDTVSKTFKTATSGTFTAGPSCISPNLFNKNDSDVGDGFIKATDGTVIAGGRAHTGYFNVIPNTTYHVTLPSYQAGSANGIAFYDQNKTFVAGLTSNASYGVSPYNFTVPNNSAIRYARLTLTDNIANTNLDGIQIEQGSTATSYRPYGENICD